MGGDLDFTPPPGGMPFGEPPSFPGGISYGTITFANGQFQPMGATTTIEVLNLLLGAGQRPHHDLQHARARAPTATRTAAWARSRCTAG